MKNMSEVITSVVSPFAVQADLQKLSQAAKKLNELSDKLTKEVSEIEVVINKLNLGVTAQVAFESWDDGEGFSSVWNLVYGKLGGKWGFLINYSSENMQFGPDADTFEQWLFKDSPREKRLVSVEKIPQLLGALVKKSDEVANEINKQVEYARKLATSLSSSQDGSKK
jgi:hypothetical protein